ncbi:MAG: hypothetical protein AAGG07_14770 [Planctomycetota bacterium]
MRSIELLLGELCVARGFCGRQARLPRNEEQEFLSRRPALHGKVAELVVSLRVTPRWVLGHVPLRSDVFAEAVLASEGKGPSSTLERFRSTVQQSFEARFGPLLDPAPDEVSSAILVLDRRDARLGWVI